MERMEAREFYSYNDADEAEREILDLYQELPELEREIGDFDADCQIDGDYWVVQDETYYDFFDGEDF